MHHWLYATCVPISCIHYSRTACAAEGVAICLTDSVCGCLFVIDYGCLKGRHTRTSQPETDTSSGPQSQPQQQARKAEGTPNSRSGGISARFKKLPTFEQSLSVSQSSSLIVNPKPVYRPLTPIRCAIPLAKPTLG